MYEIVQSKVHFFWHINIVTYKLRFPNSSRAYLYFRCDQKQDCEDNSDELNCNIVKTPKAYIKQNSPTPIDGTELQKIHVEKLYFMINEFKQYGSSMDIMVVIYSSWIDGRLQYYDLRMNETNAINKKSQKGIWLPKYTMWKTKASMKEEISYRLLEAIPLEGGKMSTFDDNNIVKVFDGRNVQLLLKQGFKAEVLCENENMLLLPFDESTCKTKVYFSESAGVWGTR